MAKNKVYSLLRTSATRGEGEQKVRVYGKLEDAKKQMQEEYLAELNDWKGWCDADMLETEDEKMSKSIYELGYYTDNHVDWIIEEQVVL